MVTGNAKIRAVIFASKALALLAAFILPAGLLFQWCATKVDERHYSMPGVLVQVDGHRMHLDCRGQGSPTVLLDAGLGDSAATWALVQPQVAEFTRVCSYDRPGLGWSEESSGARDSRHVATALEDLLLQAHIAGPYVLAGHSFGGGQPASLSIAPTRSGGGHGAGRFLASGSVEQAARTLV